MNFNPFVVLKGKLKARPFPISHTGEPQRKDNSAALNPKNDGNLFIEAMGDVTPISQDNRIEKSTALTLPEGSENESGSDALKRLTNLIRFGEGFVVADTPEYVEGTWHTVHPEVARRLHSGKFSIQAHIDLHGYNVENAKEVLDEFLRESISTGKRAVLIVHGRGLSSPVKPVLKTKVLEWLTRSPWNKWVIAFSSARACDGGAGATYVLLRQRPLTKRFRKAKKKHD